MFYVYKIENLINGKLYIGKTKDVKNRWQEHKRFARGGKEKCRNNYQTLHKAIAKYRVENFSIIVIGEYNSEQEAFDAEITNIAQFKKIGHILYNRTEGGDGRSGPKPPASEETKLKCRLASLGENNAFYGKKHTEETRAKMSAAHMGKIIPQKLTWEKVNKIRELLSKGISGAEIGRQFNVTRNTVHSIKHNRMWKIKE